MDKFIYRVFRESYSWMQFFKALFVAMGPEEDSPGKFSDKFCEGSMQGKKLKDFKYEQLGMYEYLVYVDTSQVLTFKNSVLSVDGEEWFYSKAPVRGVIYLKTNEDNPEIINSRVVVLSLKKASDVLKKEVLVVTETAPPTLFKRNRSSLALFKDAMKRAGLDYKVRYDVESLTSYELQDVFTVLSTGRVQLYKSKVQVSVKDKIRTVLGEVEIKAIDSNEVRLGKELPKGVYTLVKVDKEYAPKLEGAPSLIEIVLKSRVGFAEVKEFLKREKPMRAQGEVLFIDKTLTAEVGVRAVLRIDRTPQIYTARQGNLEPWNIFSVEWYEGSTTIVRVLTRNIKSWEFSKIDSRLVPDVYSAEGKDTLVKFTLVQTNLEDVEVVTEWEVKDPVSGVSASFSIVIAKFGADMKIINLSDKVVFSELSMKREPRGDKDYFNVDDEVKQ